MAQEWQNACELLRQLVRRNTVRQRESADAPQHARTTHSTPAHQTHTLALKDFAKPTVPAILNNLVGPLATACQLSVLGRESTLLLATYAACAAASNFVLNVGNFSVSVTMSRVGHALGARQWSALGASVRTALVVSTSFGILAAASLWCFRDGVLAVLFPPDSAEERWLAATYWPLMLARLPPMLLFRASLATLVGYQRMALASTLASALAVADAVAFFLVIRVRHLGLVWAGAVALCNCVSAASIATLATLVLRPLGAPENVNLCRGNVLTPDAPAGTSLFDTFLDSLDVFVRSLCLHGSMLALVPAVSRLGVAALAAHAITLELWMATSNIVDGFADVAGMMGSHLLGAGLFSQMRALTKAAVVASVSTGAAILIILAVYRDFIIAAFTSDAAATTILHTVWPLLCWMQPINATIFAFDGLYTATRSWRYVRNVMLVGVTVVFAPALAAAIWYPPCVSVACGLLAVWSAKASLNVWRLVCACYRIRAQLWPTWRAADAIAGVKPTQLL